MSKPARFTRRNRVDERAALAIGVVGGALAVASGARPTGSVGVDIVLIFLSVTAAVWASASAPWWAAAATAGIAAAIALNPILAAVGAVGFAVGLYVGIRRKDQSELRAVTGAIAMNVLIRSELQGFLGLSAIIGLSVGVALLIFGIRRRPSGPRRAAWLSVAGVGVLAVLCVLAFGVAGLSARSDVTQAARQAKQAVDTLNEGNYEGAAALFENASYGFARSDRTFGGPFALPGRLLPGAAQNLAAGADLAAAAAAATADAAIALRQIDPESLRLSGGSIDLDAVRAVEAPLQRVQLALSALRATVDNIDSPWIVGPVRDELDELETDFDDNEPRLQNAIDAVRLAPALLGGEGERRYLMLFTTPAEARGLGGFVGNYAELEIADGALSMSAFARRSDLEALSAATPAFCTACDDELLARYGQFGFNSGLNGSFAARAWSNITMPAHFPYIAAAAQNLYTQNTGRSIDGVIVMDPFVIQALMKYTGPVDVEELGATVQPDDAATFILEDQYVLAAKEDDSGDIDNADRIDALGTLGDEVIRRLLAGTLPPPPELAKDMGPLVAERRLLVWTNNADEQDLLDRVGLLGAIPALDEADGGFSVSVTNASGNKIEVFLDRQTTVEVQTEPNGERKLVADVTFTNNAPVSGLPRYVIGNSIGLPLGSSRLFVTFYGPPSLAEIQLNGQTTDVSPLAEAGWMGYAQFLVLASGESATYHLEFRLGQAAVPASTAGTVASMPLSTPTIWEQPLSQRGD